MIIQSGHWLAHHIGDEDRGGRRSRRTQTGSEQVRWRFPINSLQ
jgi:hypothetical protein